jgi:heat shock protein HslJ
MKAILGFAFFLLFLAGFALVMLQGRQMAQRNMPGGGSGMTGINWKPAYIRAEVIPVGSDMFVQFEVDGSIKGYGGCNDFSGSLEKSDSGIAVSALSSTRKNCAEPVMNREAAFMNALQNATRFETGATRLQLLDDDNTMLAELVDGK